MGSRSTTTRTSSKAATRRNGALRASNGSRSETWRPTRPQPFDDSASHAAAPLAAYTLLASDDLGNGWEHADLGDGRVGLYDREADRVILLTPPPLEYTRGAVALDGTPTLDMWELALGETLNHRSVLSEPERREYVRDVLDLQLVRTAEAIKPYNSADHVAVE